MDAEHTHTQESSGLFELFLWLEANKVKLIAVVGAVVVVGSAMAFMKWRKESREIEANQALFAAPALMGPAGANTNVNAASYLSVVNDYPNTMAADRAQLLGAGILFDQGKYTEAQSQFEKFSADHASHPLNAQALLGAAASVEAQGKLEDAATRYQRVVSTYPNEPVTGQARLGLARIYEGQNKLSDAFKAYDQLARPTSPYDVWANEASEHKARLLSQHPELAKTLAPAVTTTNTVTRPSTQ